MNPGKSRRGNGAVNSKQEAECRFVSSRGLLRSCALHWSSPRSSFGTIPPEIADRLSGHTGSLHLCSEMIPTFIDKHLSSLRHPFTLVTGDSDQTIGLAPVERERIAPILDHPHLVGWYAQNLFIDHPKLHHLPIGLDYHTISAFSRNEDKPASGASLASRLRGIWKGWHFWGEPTPPLEQERQITEVARNAPPLGERNHRAYSNWYRSRHRGDREECLDQVARSAAFHERRSLPRARSWRRNARHAFTLSPTGVGPDCHRTWEALLLGSVPILRSSPLDPLFRDLPVLLVENWRDVTTERLRRERDRFSNASFDFSRLTLHYWTSRIDGIASPPPMRMTIDQFTSSL